MNEQEAYEAGSGVFIGDREYVPAPVYEKVVSQLQELLRETVAFARAQGLTEEMFDEWKKSA